MRYWILIVCCLMIAGCVLQRNAEKQPSKVITKSCELNKFLDDTIVVRGYYNITSEYSSFYSIEKDSCSKDFRMELEMRNCSNYEEYSKYFGGLGSMNVYMDMTLKGVLIKDGQYGHLGSNNAAFTVLEIVQFENYICYDLSKKPGKIGKKEIIQKDEWLKTIKKGIEFNNN